MSCLNLNARNVWFPNGAEWTYTEYRPMQNITEVVSQKILGDSIVDGYPVKTMSGLLAPETPVHFLRVQNDTVWWKLNYSGSDWTIIYDFSAEAGDILDWASTEKQVIETGVFTWNGSERRYQLIDNPNTDLPEYWLEGVGKVGNSLETQEGCSHFHPIFHLCMADADGPNFKLQCYSSPLWNYDPYDFCMLSSVEESKKFELDIFPNPASHSCTVTSSEMVEEVQMFDITGRLRLNLHPEQSSVNIPLAGFNHGLYYFAVRNTEGELYTKRLLIQN